MASVTNGSLLDTNLLKELKDAKIALVCTEWNEAIVAEQIKGCEQILKQYGATNLKTLRVPGSFEIPFGCRQLWNCFENSYEKPEAIIAFGAVVRGGTPHFEYVSQAVTNGILQLNLTMDIPIIFGVLTLDTEAQAWERLGGIHGHKGEEAAITALKMIANSRKTWK